MNKRYYEELLELCRMYNPEDYDTFNFGLYVNREEGERLIKNYFNKCQRDIYGRSWHKRKTKEPVVCIGIWEYASNNAHIHTVVSAPYEVRRWTRTEGHGIWKQWRPQGSIYIEKINQLHKVVSYNRKNAYGSYMQDKLFIYNAPPSYFREKERETV